MKRFLGILFLIVMISSCDDGDLFLEDINFDKATVAKCSKNDIIYKLNEKEALLLELPGVIFPSETKTQEITIGGSIRVVYRFFNGTVNTDNICETIPPATPIVVDQWTANAGGKIIITSTPIKSTDATTNSTKITGYNHNIVLKNITFQKTNGTQVYDEFRFGDYKTTANTIPFAFTKTLGQCATSKQVYNFINSEALTLNNLEAGLIKNEITPLNAPRTALIGSTTNSLIYRSYTGLLSENYFCTTPTPVTPTLFQEWKAAAGVANSEGIIEVTTTTFGTGFKHTIVLKKAKMVRGSDDFLLGDNYIYGELITN
ncbi:hypothetical protein [Flavobacterium sp.]|uniref:hypothetical protein n=1 Tax=Flavobacterium sp. TaxID=239 RepID=UPI0022C705D0|nr:hypothetical protein [Flavobacterium sp.]MCZ8229739.1 hypothetical protein [Flavobacterium sp.]